MTVIVDRLQNANAVAIGVRVDIDHFRVPILVVKGAGGIEVLRNLKTGDCYLMELPGRGFYTSVKIRRHYFGA